MKSDIDRLMKEKDIDALFSSVPGKLITDPSKTLDAPLSELSLRKKFAEFKNGNLVDAKTRNFCG